MKKSLVLASVCSPCFIVSFFLYELILKSNNNIMSNEWKLFFGIGFLVISISVFVFLIIAMLYKIKLPTYIQVNLFEIFIVAVIIAITSLVLIFYK